MVHLKKKKRRSENVKLHYFVAVVGAVVAVVTKFQTVHFYNDDCCMVGSPL